MLLNDWRLIINMDTPIVATAYIHTYNDDANFTYCSLRLKFANEKLNPPGDTKWTINSFTFMELAMKDVDVIRQSEKQAKEFYNFLVNFGCLIVADANDRRRKFEDELIARIALDNENKRLGKVIDKQDDRIQYLENILKSIIDIAADN